MYSFNSVVRQLHLEKIPKINKRRVMFIPGSRAVKKFPMCRILIQILIAHQKEGIDRTKKITASRQN